MLFTSSILFVIALLVSVPFDGNAETLAKRDDIGISHGIPLDMKTVQDKTIVQKFVIGNPHTKQQAFVKVFAPKNSADQLTRRDTNDTVIPSAVIDMTPAECTSQVCYSGSFQAPLKTDCDTVVAAQLYNSTGSLTAHPGYVVYVTAGTCAVVFQNPHMVGSNYTLQYNWAKLGTITQNIENACFKPEDQSIGGACKIAHYLKYNFHNLVISVQRLMPETNSAPTSS